MRFHKIIICNFLCIFFASNINYSEFTYSTYKPLDEGSELNFQLAFQDFSYPLFGIQWWVSDNFQLSGNINTQTKDQFNLYNNFAIGYYIEDIKWLYSSSNFIQISLHNIKYQSPSYKWLNLSYKSRYNRGSFMVGYDINYCFWKDIKNDFIAFIIAYNIRNKIIVELKIDFINKNHNAGSLNFSVPI